MSNDELTKLFDEWTDKDGPVALHLKQKLLPVEGDGGVIFPPTYADIGYNIDTLSDGSKVATIDSVGSQANLMEPMFKSTGKNKEGVGEELNPLAALVPQIEIILNIKEKDGEKYERRQSLLDLAHRSADAVVKATPTLAKIITPAFEALNRHGNAGPLCAIAPTSLLFGVWDSRDGTGEKRPRLIRSIIRAWDVEPLFSAAQFNSAWKSLDEAQQGELEKEAKTKKIKLSEKGFADAPAVFRKVSQNAAKQMTEFRNGSPNPERRTLGGVLARGPIYRDVTVNLVALRALRGGKDDETEKKQIRKYLLSLALLAATEELDLFLREGCLLRYADAKDEWKKVPRRGEPDSITDFPSRDDLVGLATRAVEPFKAKWPKDEKGQPALEHKFDLKEAKKIISKKDADEETTTP
jgi:CRISPR-associated protein Csb1